MTIADFHIPRPLRRTLAQAARVACPPDLVELRLEEYVVDYAELQLRAFPLGFRLAMVAGMATLEASAVARYGKPFSRLPREQAGRWFELWWDSRFGLFRQLAKSLKALIVLGFYQSPPIRERLSYHPDRWIAEAARRRLQQFGVDIQRHEEELVAPNPLIAIRKVRHA
jgi:hypothetical protein